MVIQHVNAIRAKWKAIAILYVVVLFLALPRWGLAQETEREGRGEFILLSVQVNRMNLALKEIDVVVNVHVRVDRSFKMIAWVPWKEGGTFWAEGIPIPESPPWHYYPLSEMPMKNLKVATAGSVIPALPGANPFPFERYDAELVFGFNATGVMPTRESEPRAWLSWDLEQAGVWNASARVNPTDPSLMSNWRGAEDVIRSQNLTSFLSVVISLSHLPDYVCKMFVPAWGPFIFLFALSVIQFVVIRRKLTRGDHVGMFIGASVFALGQALAMREVTPPELTLAELATFLLAMIYLLVLALVIGTGRYVRERSRCSPTVT